MFFAKQASAHDVSKVTDIMDRILKEDPSYWPYGLSLDQFDGGLYMISKSASAEPVGFVGWQERREGAKKVGYYAIGVLPEFRRQGFAKQAVQTMLREKAAGVDEVRALVCSHNVPSQRLAKSLPGVDLNIFEKIANLQKEAAVPAWLPRLIGAVGTAAGTAALADQAVDPHGRSLASTLQPWTWDKERGLMGAANLAAGAGAWHLFRKGKVVPAITAVALAPTKDLVIKGLGSLSRLDRLVDTTKNVLEQPKEPSLIQQIPKSVLLGTLGLGAGGLGLAALLAKRKSDLENAKLEAARAGRVKVTLPTKSPGDAETMLDLPVDDVKLSDALMSRLARDTRRRLYKETRDRTVRRKPKDPSNPTPQEMEDAALAEEEAALSKEASIVALLKEIRPDFFKQASAAQPTVPSPPGGSPAMKMQQQQAQANSIDTSTAANPQIMKAQQQAAEASMQAQQQVAQVEQAQQQQLNQKDEERRQQLAQADQQRQQVAQENQILKMQLEKSKIEADLEKAKHKAHAELNDARSSAAGAQSADHDERLSKLISNRIARVRRRLSKSAMLDPQTGRPTEEDAGAPLDPQTGRPQAPEPKIYAPGTAQNINTHGLEYVASGGMPQLGVYRASYGPVGDFLYRSLVRPNALRPSHATLSGAAAMNNPDRLAMVSALSDQARSWWNRPDMESTIAG